MAPFDPMTGNCKRCLGTGFTRKGKRAGQPCHANGCPYVNNPGGSMSPVRPAAPQGAQAPAPPQVSCSWCGGNGIDNGRPCVLCNGIGKVKRVPNSVRLPELQKLAEQESNWADHIRSTRYNPEHWDD